MHVLDPNCIIVLKLIIQMQISMEKAYVNVVFT